MANDDLPDDLVQDLLNMSNYPGFNYDPNKNDTLIGQLDPFIGPAQQTSRMRSYCQIVVDGTDVTEKMEPHLISVHVTIGKPVSAAEIELDDRDGNLPLPPVGAYVNVALGWDTEESVTTFMGWIQDIEHGFGRKQGGRRMWVHAKGWDQLSSGLKDPIQDNLGEGARPGQSEGTKSGLSQWITQLSGHANVTAQISSALDKFNSDYWHIANASPMHEIENLSQRFNFDYLFTGGPNGEKQLIIQSLGEKGLSCVAVWRENLIGWRVRPFVARVAFGGSKSDTYDPKKAGRDIFKQMFGVTQAPFDQADAIMAAQAPDSTPDQANSTNEGNQTASESSVFGNGRIMINGEPKATWNSLVLLVGARPGVDGIYRIKVVEHVYSRQGFITNLEVWPLGQNRAGSYSVYRTWLPKAQPNIGGQGTVSTSAASPSSTSSSPVSVVNSGGNTVTTTYADGTRTIQNEQGTTTLHPDGSEDFFPR